nr:CAP domain-containing protein [uncultured Oscillibacter sp.]
MKSKRNLFRKLAAGFLAAALLAAPAQAADPEIRVGSYKGNELSAGERSALIIGPGGAAYTASSSDPEVVSVEQVLTFWVAVAKAEGSAEITVTDGSGGKGQLTLTVGEAPPPAEIDLSANMDIRLEMVEYINQARRENGRPELPIEESLMNAAQDVSARQVREHRPYDHQALIRYGWPHAGMYNLTVFSPNAHPDIARKAVEDWVNSTGHLETLLMEEGSCVGTGVTINGPWAYCYMVVGDPTAHNPYE